MRIATFNILGGRSPADGMVDEYRFADAVRQIGADVLALQEVDRNQPRSKHADLTAIAADAMGATEHRFVAALSGTPGATWEAATGEEQPDAAAYGIALLSRYPVVGWSVVRLDGLPFTAPYVLHGRRWPQRVRDEPRVALVGEVDTPRGRLDVATTHLSFLPGWNRRQLRALMQALGTREPLVLLGDLNLRPGPAGRITRMTPLAGGPTFPAHHPTHQIDHVLSRGHVGTATGGPMWLPVSDHYALVADLD